MNNIEMVCIAVEGSLWVRCLPPKERMPGPKRGDIVTKMGERTIGGELYFILKEWPDPEGYKAEAFVPLNKTSQKEEMKTVTFTEIEKELPVSAN